MENNKIVLVSGGSRGLGAAIVRQLLHQDFIVATFSRSETDFINRTAEENKHNRRFFWGAVDATEPAELKAFVSRVNREYGRIDALVNNVASNVDQLLTLMSAETVRGLLGLNLESMIHLSRYVSPLMLRQRDGVILNISSVVGIRGYKGVSVYSATKAALNGFSRSLARELGRRGIRVNSILPGFMETDMTRDMSDRQRDQIIRRTPLGRLGRVEDVVGLVGYLLSSQAGFITGQEFVVDGGLTC